MDPAHWPNGPRSLTDERPEPPPGAATNDRRFEDLRPYGARGASSYVRGMTEHGNPSHRASSGDAVTLDEADCYLRLRSQSLGRVGVKLADDLVILPVYYAVMDDDIVFRTAPGTKLDAALLKTKVAFEVDGVSPGWSVLVRGHVEELRDHGAQVHARTLLGNDWPAGAREQLVRIRAEKVTGRRLPPAT